MIHILYLYYDLMNLYGEIGNIKVLTKCLDEEGIKYKVDKLSINDKIDFKSYDFIYIGMGTENNQRIVLEDILKYKEDIKEYIENDGFILSTGNSLELFGKSINDIDALDIFPYTSAFCNTIVGDALVKCFKTKNLTLGFQNRRSCITENKYDLYEDCTLGVNYKNFYGSYLLGPLLVRNPEFTKFLIESLLESKEYEYKKLDLNLEDKAYKSYLETYKK